MITPSYSSTATERVLPRMALDFTTAVTDPRVATARAANTATRFNSSGLIEIVNANLPRYDFSPNTLACRGQLIEEARSNLFLNSLVDGTNLATQSVTLSAVAYTLSFYGSGAVTISGGHSATVAGIGDFPNRKTYTFTPTAGSSTFTVSGDVKFAQLEAGAFATSFIPTTTGSVTRNADAVSMTGTNFSSWYNTSEGTFVARFLSSVGAAANLPRIFEVSDGTTGNRTRCYLGANNTTTQISSGGSSVASIGNTLASAYGAYNQIAVAYKTDNFGAAANGGTIGTDTAGAVPVAPIRINIGSDYSAASLSQLNGYMAELYFYNQRLINSEVVAFSKQG